MERSRRQERSAEEKMTFISKNSPQRTADTFNKRFAFWCPKGCGKCVFYDAHRNYVPDKYICFRCNTKFTEVCLEKYGNNIQRIIRSKRAPVIAILSEEEMKKGVNNEW